MGRSCVCRVNTTSNSGCCPKGCCLKQSHKEAATMQQGHTRAILLMCALAILWTYEFAEGDASEAQQLASSSTETLESSPKNEVGKVVKQPNKVVKQLEASTKTLTLSSPEVNDQEKSNLPATETLAAKDAIIAKLQSRLHHDANAHLTATKAGERKEEPNKVVVGEADNEEAEEDEEAEVGRRGGAFLSTTGSFTLSSGSNTAGNDEALRLGDATAGGYGAPRRRAPPPPPAKK